MRAIAASIKGATGAAAAIAYTTMATDVADLLRGVIRVLEGGDTVAVYSFVAAMWLWAGFDIYRWYKERKKKPEQPGVTTVYGDVKVVLPSPENGNYRAVFKDGEVIVSSVAPIRVAGRLTGSIQATATLGPLPDEKA